MRQMTKLALTAILAMGSTTTWAQGLKDVYRDYFLVGVAVNQRNVTNAQQQALIKREFSSMTAENDMGRSVQLGECRPHSQLRPSERHQAARTLPDVALADRTLDA